MENKITLIKNNDNKELRDLQWVAEFYEFLQGNVPDQLHFGHGHKPKMTQKKAFSIIWYLQEHFPVFPSNIERCDNCGELFDNDSDGLYWQTKAKHYCGSCSYMVPENYDRGKK